MSAARPQETARIRFVKAHGTGNDFVLLPDVDDAVVLTPGLVRALCHRRFGVGGDGVIRIGRARPGNDADVFMDYWNADGGIAEMCGNGVRCVAKHVVDHGLVRGDLVRVDTRAGVKSVQVVERHADGAVARVRVDMGAPQLLGDVQLDVSPLTVLARAGGGGVATADQRTIIATAVSMGNPHAVVFVDDVAAAPVERWGPTIERDPRFPEGTNVEFISVPARDRVVGRIWERGVGETMASGTGSSAMAVAAHLRGGADRHVVVELPGGELRVDWDEDTLHMTGPAVEVGAGDLDEAWLRATT